MEKPVLLFDNRFDDGTPTVLWPGTEAGYDVLNLKDLRPYTFWKSAGTSPTHIIIDCGVGKSADSVAVLGHNLATVGATIQVLCSDDNFVADTTVALGPFTVNNDKAFFRAFASQTKRYWKFYLSGLTAAPQLAVLIVGNRLQFPRYLMKGYDPQPEQIHGSSTRSQTGQPLGAEVRYIEHQFRARFQRVTDAFFTGTFKPAWDAHISKLKPFFWVWDYGTHPDEVYFVKVPDKFSLKAPFDPVRRTLDLSFEGIKE